MGIGRFLPALWALLLLIGATGCPPKPSADSEEANNKAGTASHQDRPAVPLRVWFVGDEAAAPLIQRQWQASYDRPLELSMLSAEALLQHKSCECDVLIYPAMLLGELTARDWLAELPQRLQPTAKNSDEEMLSTRAAPRRDATAAQEPDSRPEPQPAAWQEQAKYGRRVWGLSLSVSMPVVIANFSLPPRGDQARKRGSHDGKFQSLLASNHRCTDQSPRRCWCFEGLERCRQ